MERACLHSVQIEYNEARAHEMIYKANLQQPPVPTDMPYGHEQVC